MTPNPMQSPQGQPAPPPAAPYAPGPYGAPPAPYYPQPMGYYPPPMVMAPVFMPQPGQKTFEGLKWLRYGSITVMAYNVVAIVVGIIALSVVSSFNGANPQAGLNALGALAAIVAAGLVLGVLGLIAFILGLLGFYNMSEGKQEFGPGHLANVKDATKWFIIACVSFVASVMASVFLGISAAFQLGATPNQIASQFALSAAVSGAILVVYVYALAQVMQKLLGSLMTEAGRKMKGTFVLLSLVGAVATLGIRVASAFLFTGAFTNLDAANQVNAVGSFVGVVSVITAYLYMRQVQSAEAGARNMIASGQFNPDGAAPPPGAPPQGPPSMVTAMPAAAPPVPPTAP